MANESYFIMGIGDPEDDLKKMLRKKEDQKDSQFVIPEVAEKIFQPDRSSPLFWGVFLFFKNQLQFKI